MVRYDARVEHKADLIVYHVQTNEQMELSDDSRHDIFHTVRDVANYWKAEYDKVKKENIKRRWNELRLWIKENPTATHEDIFYVMDRLNEGKYIRDYRLDKY